jgi:hypothetical protein
VGQHTALLGGVELVEGRAGKADFGPAQGHRALEALGRGELDVAVPSGLLTQPVELGPHTGLLDGDALAEAIEDARPGHGKPEQKHSGGCHPGHEEERAHPHPGDGHRGQRRAVGGRGSVRALDCRVGGADDERQDVFGLGVGKRDVGRGRPDGTGGLIGLEGGERRRGQGLGRQGEAPRGKSHPQLQGGGEKAAQQRAAPGQVPKPEGAQKPEALQRPGAADEDARVQGVGEEPGGADGGQCFAPAHEVSGCHWASPGWLLRER